MKRIFFLFSILLCSLTMTAQSAWMFNRGDSISWQPTQDMTVTFEKDPAGFFWQNIQTNNLDVVRMPIKTGDGIKFADTPFLQVEKKNIEVTNEGNRQFEVRLKTNISDWSSIICQPQADWVRIVDVNGRHFPVITYNFEYDANYTGESRETQINFSHQELSDVVTVFSIGETATFEVSPKEITVTNNQDPRQFTVTLSSNVSEVLADFSWYAINGEWIRLVKSETMNNSLVFTFEYDMNYSRTEDREAEIVLYNEGLNVRQTVKVISTKYSYPNMMIVKLNDGTEKQFRLEGTKVQFGSDYFQFYVDDTWHNYSYEQLETISFIYSTTYK